MMEQRNKLQQTLIEQGFVSERLQSRFMSICCNREVKSQMDLTLDDIKTIVHRIKIIKSQSVEKYPATKVFNLLNRLEAEHVKK